MDEHGTASEGARRWERWLAVLILVIAVLFAGIWAWGAFRVKASPKDPVEPGKAAVVPDLASARKTLTDYFEAADDAQKTGLLHDAARVKPLWLDYYHRRSKPLPLLVRLDRGRLAKLGERAIALFQAELNPGGVRPIALIWEGDHFGVDWESWVGYGTMDWIEWVETKPVASQLLRVYLSKAVVDGLSNAERDVGWAEVVAEHPDGLQPLPVRIPPGTLFSVDFRGRQRVPVTAEFRFSGGKAELVKLHYEGWSR